MAYLAGGKRVSRGRYALVVERYKLAGAHHGCTGRVGVVSGRNKNATLSQPTVGKVPYLS